MKKMKKVILILIDSLRADAFKKINEEENFDFLKESTYCLETQTIMPSWTVPCHYSLFHSIPSEEHAILDNSYMPQVRATNGLFEALSIGGKTTAMFYSYENLRDMVKPGFNGFSLYIRQSFYGRQDNELTNRAIEEIKRYGFDFTFLYLGWTDIIGHKSGWMSDDYIDTATNALRCTKQVLEALGDEYTIVLMADHGGHGRSHGSAAPEDMTIPLLFMGKDMEKGKKLESASLLDVTPTIANMLGVKQEEDWVGKILIK